MANDIYIRNFKRNYDGKQKNENCNGRTTEFLEGDIIYFKIIKSYEEKSRNLTIYIVEPNLVVEDIKVNIEKSQFKMQEIPMFSYEGILNYLIDEGEIL